MKNRLFFFFGHLAVSGIMDVLKTKKKPGIFQDFRMLQVSTDEIIAKKCLGNGWCDILFAELLGCSGREMANVLENMEAYDLFNQRIEQMVHSVSFLNIRP